MIWTILFLSECLHLQSHLYILTNIILTSITPSKYLWKKSLHIEIFPNINTALRIVVSVPVFNKSLCLKIHTNWWKDEQFFSIGLNIKWKVQRIEFRRFNWHICKAQMSMWINHLISRFEYMPTSCY